MDGLSVLIVDDERSARDLLINLLTGVSWIKKLTQVESVDDAMPEIIEGKPDVILLDIQMPRKNGFVLIDQLHKQGIFLEVIFISAYEKYAIKAIKASAFDYLLKPVKKEDLLSSLERVYERVKFKRSENSFVQLMSYLNDHKKLKFRNRTGFTMIDPDNILYCAADSNYTILELKDNKNLVVSMNLGKVEEMLPEVGFIRISRSVIININYLTYMDRKTMICQLGNQEEHSLSVSRKYLKGLEDSCDNKYNFKNGRGQGKGV